MIFILTTGMVGLSLLTSYITWTFLRVLRLRQDLLDIRQAMFDEAVKQRATTDPAYTLVRDLLNNLISAAPEIRVVTFVFFWGRASRGNEIPLSMTPEMQSIVETTMQNISSRLYKYLFNETASGWLLHIILLQNSVNMSVTDRFNRLGTEAVKRTLNSGYDLTIPNKRKSDSEQICPV